MVTAYVFRDLLVRTFSDRALKPMRRLMIRITSVSAHCKSTKKNGMNNATEIDKISKMGGCEIAFVIRLRSIISRSVLSYFFDPINPYDYCSFFSFQ